MRSSDRRENGRSGGRVERVTWDHFVRQGAGLLDETGVEYDERGNVKASEKAYQTNIPKVFTAGDMRRGQSLVVWAISEGRECARKVDEFLMGSSLLETKDASLVSLAV